MEKIEGSKERKEGRSCRKLKKRVLNPKSEVKKNGKMGPQQNTKKDGENPEDVVPYQTEKARLRMRRKGANGNKGQRQAEALGLRGARTHQYLPIFSTAIRLQAVPVPLGTSWA